MMRARGRGALQLASQMEAHPPGALALAAGVRPRAPMPAPINVPMALARLPQLVRIPASYAQGGQVGADDGFDPEDLTDDQMQEVIDYLANQGQGHDDRIAHMNAREAAILKQLGGSGSINPATGIQQFDDGDGDGGGDAGDGAGDGTGEGTGDGAGAGAGGSEGSDGAGAGAGSDGTGSAGDGTGDGASGSASDGTGDSASSADGMGDASASAADGTGFGDGIGASDASASDSTSSSTSDSTSSDAATSDATSSSTDAAPSETGFAGLTGADFSDNLDPSMSFDMDPSQSDPSNPSAPSNVDFASTNDIFNDHLDPEMQFNMDPQQFDPAVIADLLAQEQQIDPTQDPNAQYQAYSVHIDPASSKDGDIGELSDKDAPNPADMGGKDAQAAGIAGSAAMGAGISDAALAGLTGALGANASGSFGLSGLVGLDAGTPSATGISGQTGVNGMGDVTGQTGNFGDYASSAPAGTSSSTSSASASGSDSHGASVSSGSSSGSALGSGSHGGSNSSDSASNDASAVSAANDAQASQDASDNAAQASAPSNSMASNTPDDSVPSADVDNASQQQAQSPAALFTPPNVTQPAVPDPPAAPSNHPTAQAQATPTTTAGAISSALSSLANLLGPSSAQAAEAPTSTPAPNAPNLTANTHASGMGALADTPNLSTSSAKKDAEPSKVDFGNIGTPGLVGMPSPQAQARGVDTAPAARGAPAQISAKDYLQSQGYEIDGVPLGMTQNNPANMKFSGSAWQNVNLTGFAGRGTTKDQGDPQAAFSSPLAGMISAARLAEAKFISGRNTVGSMIAAPGGWTPGNVAAANNIARDMGQLLGKAMDRDSQINLKDPAQMQAFMQALVRQEQGPAAAAYPAQMYRDAVAANASRDSAFAQLTPAPYANYQAKGTATAPNQPQDWRDPSTSPAIQAQLEPARQAITAARAFLTDPPSFSRGSNRGLSDAPVQSGIPGRTVDPNLLAQQHGVTGPDSPVSVFAPGQFTEQGPGAPTTAVSSRGPTGALATFLRGEQPASRLAVNASMMVPDVPASRAELPTIANPKGLFPGVVAQGPTFGIRAAAPVAAPTTPVEVSKLAAPYVPNLPEPPAAPPPALQPNGAPSWTGGMPSQLAAHNWATSKPGGTPATTYEQTGPEPASRFESAKSGIPAGAPIMESVPVGHHTAPGPNNTTVVVDPKGRAIAYLDPSAKAGQVPSQGKSGSKAGSSKGSDAKGAETQVAQAATKTDVQQDKGSKGKDEAQSKGQGSKGQTSTAPQDKIAQQIVSKGANLATSMVPVVGPLNMLSGILGGPTVGSFVASNARAGEPSSPDGSGGGNEPPPRMTVARADTPPPLSSTPPGSTVLPPLDHVPGRGTGRTYYGPGSDLTRYGFGPARQMYDFVTYPTVVKAAKGGRVGALQAYVQGQR